MGCAELNILREQATRFYKELGEKRRTAREHPGTHPDHPLRSDYDALLQRKLFRLSSLIENHVAQHRCQQ